MTIHSLDVGADGAQSVRSHVRHAIFLMVAGAVTVNNIHDVPLLCDGPKAQ